MVEKVSQFIQHQQGQFQALQHKDQEEKKHSDKHAAFLFLFVHALAASGDVNLKTQESLADSINTETQNLSRIVKEQDALDAQGNALSNNPDVGAAEINKESLSLQVRESELTAEKSEATQNTSNALFNIGNLGTEQDILTNIGSNLINTSLNSSNNIKRSRTA